MTGTDGAALESLVAQIEELFVPAGFSVVRNAKDYVEGIQYAEFDVVIEGRFGPTALKWLIECRDREAQGPAPGAWIEQLVGRRERFGFNKVIAVSTTGFSAGAVDYANQSGIEIRTVRRLEPIDVASWLVATTMTFAVRTTKLSSAHCSIQNGADAERKKEAAAKILAQATGARKVLRAIDSGSLFSIDDVFLEVVTKQGAFEEAVANGPAETIHIVANYPNDCSHYVIDTDCGEARIEQITFDGEFSVREEQVPFGRLREYRTNEGPLIAQSATAALNAPGQLFEVELHRLADTSETAVVVRRSRQAQSD